MQYEGNSFKQKNNEDSQIVIQNFNYYKCN